VHDAKGACFEDFCDLMLDDHAPYGSVWSHMINFWNKRNDPNILFLKYEDMKRDLPAIIRKCAEFLEIKYQLTDEDVTKLCEHLKFKKMQTNPAVNLETIMFDSQNTEPNGSQSSIKFIRKGEIGDWKNYMTPAMSDKFDQWIKLRFGGTGLEFEFE
jgi:hypothetical protein